MAAPAPELHTRWNFIVIVLDCAFFMAGMAFVESTTVMPVLLAKLTDSKAVIGLMGTVQRAGWLLPQLLGTSFVLHRPYRKAFVLVPALLSRLPFYALAVAFLHPWARTHPGALLVLLVGGYTFFWFGDGFGGVPWHDIIARTIPATMRGRFFGTMQALSGILILGSAEVVRRVLASTGPGFPRDFGLLFAFLCVGITLSTICLALIREPKAETVEEAQSIWTIVRSIPRTLRGDARLRRLILAQNLCGLAGLAWMFYAPYAYQRLHLPDATAGLFLIAGVIGSVGSSFVWAYLSDRLGSTKVIRGVAVTLIATPALALLVPPLVRALGTPSALPYLYGLVFLSSGASGGGLWMGFINYVMEISPEDKRPLFIGLQSTLSAPTVVMPLLGGVLLKVIPFEALFAAVVVTSLVSAVFVRGLPEPRHAPELVEAAS